MSTAQWADTQFAWLRMVIPMTVVRQLKIRAGCRHDWGVCFWAAQIYPKLRNTAKEVNGKK